MRFAVIIERAGLYVSAHVSDRPGCVATAATVDAVLHEIREAVGFPIDGRRADGGPVPEPTSIAADMDA